MYTRRWVRLQRWLRAFQRPYCPKHGRVFWILFAIGVLPFVWVSGPYFPAPGETVDAGGALAELGFSALFLYAVLRLAHALIHFIARTLRAYQNRNSKP